MLRMIEICSASDVFLRKGEKCSLRHADALDRTQQLTKHARAGSGKCCMLLARRAARAASALRPRRDLNLVSAAMGLVHGKDAKSTHDGSFHDLISADIQGNEVNFKQFAGKVCVITNVASE